MSRYVVEVHDKKFVFGWDPPLNSFFLQVHDHNLSEEENPTVWLVDDIYEIEDLATVIKENGFELTYEMCLDLYRDKDDGR